MGLQIMQRVAGALLVIGLGLVIWGNVEHSHALTEADTQSLSAAFAGYDTAPDTSSADTWHTVTIGGWVAIGAGVVLLLCTLGLNETPATAPQRTAATATQTRTVEMHPAAGEGREDFERRLDTVIHETTATGWRLVDYQAPADQSLGASLTFERD